MTASEILMYYRQTSGLSMREIAEKVGLSHMTIGNAARGMPVSPETLAIVEQLRSKIGPEKLERQRTAVEAILRARKAAAEEDRKKLLGARVRAHHHGSVDGVLVYLVGRWSHPSQRFDAVREGVQVAPWASLVRSERWRAGRWRGSFWTEVRDVRRIEVLG